MSYRGSLIRPCWALACSLLAVATVSGQDLEPRRWTHLPVDMNVFGIALTQGEGDVAFDPVLKLKDVTVETRLQIASFVRTFDLLGKSARVDVLVPYRQSRWEGKLDGTSAHVRRTGFGDPRLRMSVNLVGAPPLKGQEYKRYREARPTNTVMGAALALTLPLGEYESDKLLNPSQNRYVIRPQVGVLHTRGPWSYELTGSVFFFTDNKKFFDGNTREQEPLYALQAHVVRSFPSGWWTSVGTGYGWGGRSTVDGEDKNDRKGDWLSGVSFGFPIAKDQSVKFGYLRRRTQKDTGLDSETVAAGWSVRF
jgi:hypothetical protein